MSIYNLCSLCNVKQTAFLKIAPKKKKNQHENQHAVTQLLKQSFTLATCCISVTELTDAAPWMASVFPLEKHFHVSRTPPSANIYTLQHYPRTTALQIHILTNKGQTLTLMIFLFRCNYSGIAHLCYDVFMLIQLWLYTVIEAESWFIYSFIIPLSASP